MTLAERLVYVDEKIKEVRESGHLDYRSTSLPTWCPGCGYFSILEGVTAALNDQGVKRDDAVILSGIGCSSRFPFFINTYGFHTLHGRVLPVATGVKVANEHLTVIAVGGDGDGFAIGGGHLPHAARRNIDITYILFDNGIYGLTKGQTSPTSAVGFRTTTTPYENTDLPLNPLMMVLSYGASWVGQSYVGYPDHLKSMIIQAMSHKGFSYLHVLSPCVTFDKTHRTYTNLGMQVRYLPKDHNPSDLMMALRETTGTPALGQYYQENRPTLGDNMDAVIKKAGGNCAGST